MPVSARRLIRKMRGGAQAHLIEASDGHHYVVKFRNNPQHRRILVNEFIAAHFLDYLQITAPPTSIVSLDSEFLRLNPEVYIQLGRGRQEVPPGWHFGSRFPGDPARTAVYDFIPDALIEKVENLAEFTGVLAFDKWMANADSRQAVFLRARVRDFTRAGASHPLRIGFVSLMIDHGFVFNGPHWDFPDSPMQGLYFRPVVYGNVRGWQDFEPWIERIKNFPEEVIDEALKRIPPIWLEGDETLVVSLMEKLLARRSRVASLIEQSSRRGVNPFPNWRR